jgi:hypothetical protein
VDKAWEQRKLEARKMLENGDEFCNSKSIQNMAAINASFYGPYGKVGKTKNNSFQSYF